MNKIKGSIYLIVFCCVIYLALGGNFIKAEHTQRFNALFGIELPKESSRVIYVSYGVLDVPRFEFKLPSEFFEAVIAASKLAGYPEWVKHNYDRNEPVSVLERYLYGYAYGKSIFFTTEKKVDGRRIALIYDPDYQYFIAINYVN